MRLPLSLIELPHMQPLPAWKRGVLVHGSRLVWPVRATASILGMPAEQVSRIGLATLLHDLGKLALPGATLLKPGPLTTEEWALVHRHPEMGVQMLSLAGEDWAELAPIIVAHHERWDGGGYPRGLARHAVPLEARILSVVDAYDAMTTPRVYRRPLSRAEARAELERCSGQQFDPLVVAAFLQVLDEQGRVHQRQEAYRRKTWEEVQSRRKENCAAITKERTAMSDLPAPPHTTLSSATAPFSISTADARRLLDISPDGLLIVNPAGTIAQMNRQIEALFGYGREELLGQPLELLLPQRSRAAHAAHREHYFSTPRTRPMGVGLHLDGRRKDSTEFPVEISLNPVLLDGALHALGVVRDVSPMRAAERERLQQSQQLGLQAHLINRAHDAILVRDPASRVLFWNTGAEELYGWPAQEAQGRVSHSLLKTRFPVDRAVVEAQLEREGRWEGELVHTCRDGRLMTVESRQVLVRGDQGQPSAILEINRDLSARRESERIAQAMYLETAGRLSFMHQVLDALPNGIYLVHGPDARLLLATRATTGLWGAEWPADQPMLEFLATNGISLCDAQGRPLRSEHYATLRAVSHAETVLQQQETIRRPDGSSLPVLVNALPLHPQQGSGQLVQEGEAIALVIPQDVTVLKEAEYLKDEFVGIVAHELRMPLAALRGFVDMLLVQTARGHGSRLADWQQEALEEIGMAVTRMVGLTEDLLDVTRVQTGRLRLERTPTNVVSLTKHVAASLQQVTTRHQLEVRTEDEQLLADIDPGRIEQVLTNLVGNAIKYSPQGGPVNITLWGEGQAGMVGISVQDHGIGIPASQQAKLFGRFMRADNAVAWGISGTGLGLYLCRELVEWQGGQLWFESAEGTGSTFFLRLPGVSAATPPV